MNIPDLITIIENISESFREVQRFISGLAYVLGLIFIFLAVMKYRGVATTSNEKMSVPTAYLLSGSALLFLPSALGVLSNTTFGITNILSYQKSNTMNLYDAINIIVRTIGIIWFVRGCVLLAHASEPGVQHGPKGLTFLVAGILAFNFQMTYAYLAWALNKMVDYGMKPF